jgi:hypothetical protein
MDIATPFEMLHYTRTSVLTHVVARCDKLAAPMSRANKTLTLVFLATFALILVRTAWVGDDV